GIAVPRLRQPPLVVPLGALIAALVCALPAALAQDASSDQYLFRPQVDGDPRNPPRFNRMGGEGTTTGVSRFGKSPGFNSPPASGAGSTGFDSTNPRRQKDKKGQKAKSKAGTPSAAALSNAATGAQASA